MDANFAPGTLETLTTYYWRVDEDLFDESVEPGPVYSRISPASLLRLAILAKAL